MVWLGGQKIERFVNVNNTLEHEPTMTYRNFLYNSHYSSFVDQKSVLFLKFLEYSYITFRNADELTSGLIHHLNTNLEERKPTAALKVMKWCSHQFIDKMEEEKGTIPQFHFEVPNKVVFPMLIRTRSEIEEMMFDILCDRFGKNEATLEQFLDQSIGDRKDCTQSLLKDLRAVVLGYLGYKSIISLSKTCRHWHEILTADYNNRFWKKYYFQNFFNRPPNTLIPKAFFWSDLVQFEWLRDENAKGRQDQYVEEHRLSKKLTIRDFFKQTRNILRLPPKFPQNNRFLETSTAKEHWRKLGIWYDCNKHCRTKQMQYFDEDD